MIYAMVNLKRSERYTEHALKSFFKNTSFSSDDKFYLINNDSNYYYNDVITNIDNTEPLTFAQNVNQIIAIANESKSDFIFLNNDLSFTPKWEESLTANNNIISVPNCNIEALTLDEFDPNFDYVLEDKFIIQDKIFFPVFYLPYNVYSRVGYFDDNFINGGEDIDYRIRAENICIKTMICMNSYVLHFGGKSTWKCEEVSEDTLQRNSLYRERLLSKWGALRVLNYLP